MRKILAVWLTCLAVIILLVLVRRSPREAKRTDEPSAQSPVAGQSTASTSVAPTKGSAVAAAAVPTIVSNLPILIGTPGGDLAATARAMVRPPPAPAPLEFTNVEPAIVLENVRTAIRSFDSAFNGNPVGNNSEITKALNGGNPKQTRFLREEEGLRINEKGELVDPWGTPFFFHQLAAREMEIRSAGPDRVLWTSDDLVTK